MSYEKFSKNQEEMIRQMKKAQSQGELLNNIPDDMKKRLNEIMNNEAELKRILSSERAKALFDIIKKDEER
ncbi:MAG: hypothetical protein K2G60_01890 [Oscillospiraceae bacterium]|nr:hypothetical protein [Oscillospiraceae bacterium]